MTNPLIEKFYELHPEKKEKPKFIKGENAKVEIKGNSSGVICAKNFPPLISHDIHSGNDAFLQIAEKVKNGTAQVTTVSLQVDAHGVFSYGKRITFDVYDYEP